MGGVEITPAVMAGGVVAMLVGVVGLILALGLSRASSGKVTVSDHVNAYGASGSADRSIEQRKKAAADASIAASAKAAAAEMLSRSQSLEAKIASRLDGAGISIKPAEWVLIHSGLVVVSSLFWVLLSGGRVVFIVVGLALGIIGPWIFLGIKKSRRLKAFGSMLPDTLQLMSSSLSAGLSLAQSVDTIVREGSDPVAAEFKRVVVESRLGVPLEDAMAGVAERMQSPDFEWVVMAIRIQREVGGNLAELLLTVAATLREREYVRRHVRALSAEGRLSMYILGGLPPAFLLYLGLSRPDYTKPFFTTPVGFVLLGAMTVLLGVGVFWMSKVAKVEL